MNFATDSLPAGHLLVIEAPEADLTALCAVPFTFSQWLPVPEGFFEADEFDVLAFHLIYGDLAQAQRIAEELNEPWPFDSAKPSSREVRAYLAQHPELNRTAAHVLQNLQTRGYVSLRAWKQAHWGAARDMAPATVSRPQEALAWLRFDDAEQRLAACLELSLRHPRWQVSAVVVAPAVLAQFWFDSTVKLTGLDTISLNEQRFKTLDELQEASWLEHLPPGIAF